MIPIETSAGAVIFLRKDKKIYFLLLHYVAGHWDLVKGHVEKGETLKETIVREVKEETGIEDLKFIPGFQEKTEYSFKSNRVGGKTAFKINKLFLAETKKEEINLSFEHTDFVWLPYHQALEKITFGKTKKVLKKAMKFLKAKD